MKATRFILAALFVFTAAWVSGGDKESKSVVYTVDPSQSSIEWHGRKVTGEHFGTINLKEGKLEFNGNKITGGKFVVDMNSIACSDLTDQSTNAKLVGHLKSDDFFSVAKYPNAELEIINAAHKGGNKYDLTGNLTIKGITHEVVFPATVNVANGISAEAEITIDRSKYDVRYGSGKFFDNLGDKMIYDNFSLKIKLVGDQEVL